MIGLRVGDISADGVMTKAPCGGAKAGPSPVDRRKGGLKRCVAAEATGVPLGLVSAGANRHDSPLLAPTRSTGRAQVGALPADVTVHLDGGYDSHVTRALLPSWASTARSPARASPRPSRPGSAGSSSACTPG
jgi:hypothetical protein